MGPIKVIGPELVPNLDDCYLRAGSHPEIVNRVWDQLGDATPEGRCLLGGVPVLVAPRSGIILAVCLGTNYALRLPEAALAQAL